MSIKWVQLAISWKRMIEVFSLFVFVMFFLGLEIVCLIVFVAILFYCGSIGKTVCAVYLIFLWFDRKADQNCSRGQGYECLRGWFIWKHFTDYFPLKLVKTVDLPANKNYLFAIFPHGVISCGAFGHFITSTTSFRELFPGIRSKISTLRFHFLVPIFREFILGWGTMSSKSTSIKIALSQSNEISAECNADGYTSNAVCLVVGGAQEALNARPGVYKLVLKRRKGFIKCAIQTGAPIVPVFSFNEVEVYDQLSNEPGTRLRRIQEVIKKVTTIAPVVFIGRGFFQYSFGLMPRRYPITTVVGEPLETVKNTSPTNTEIEEYHEKFVFALTKLFEEHKHKYINNADKTRLIIE